MIMDFLKGVWCYWAHQRRGHAVIFNVTDNTWKCITCKHIVTKD